MRFLFGRFSQYVLLSAALGVLMSACGGSVHSVVPRPEKAQHLVLPMVDGTSPPTELWTTSCGGCGIAGFGGVTVSVDAWNVQTGSNVHESTFHEDSFNNDFVTTSPDQRHVYASVTRFGGIAIADIDPQSYGIRYYAIPGLARDNQLAAMATSSSGARIFASAGGTLYAINTVSRTINASVPSSLTFLAVSPDDHGLFGSDNNGLVILNQSTLSTVVRNSTAPRNSAVAATNSTVYTLGPRNVPMFDAHTLAPRGSVYLAHYPQSLQIDQGTSRLFVSAYPTASSYSASDTIVIDTVHDKIVTTLTDAVMAAVDPITHVLYVSNSSGQLCAVAPVTYARTCVSGGPPNGFNYATTTN